MLATVRCSDHVDDRQLAAGAKFRWRALATVVARPYLGRSQLQLAPGTVPVTVLRPAA
ncbi:MAG: hypothetical protein ACR2NR_22445 [Solirubrobacteraceae bacterium]